MAGLLTGTVASALACSAAAQTAAVSAPDPVQAQIEALQGQVRLLQDQLTALRAQVTAPGPVATAAGDRPLAPPAPPAPSPAPQKPTGPVTAIEWKGAPELSTPEGWRFKVRGRVQYDLGYVPNPEGRLPGANFGFNGRSRRIRLGVEGWLPGDIQYKSEMDFANAAIGYGDVILFWQPKGEIYSFGVGNYDTFQNLEQPSSSRYISFLERAQTVEAFDQTRHVGAWMTLAGRKDDWRFNLGLFGDRIRADNTNGQVQGSYGNDDWMLASRALYTPPLSNGRLHFGVNYQRRRFQTNDLAQAYQTRPFTATTDQRYVSTGAIAAHGDEIVGLEAAAVLGSFHVVAEAQRLKVDAIRPGEALTGSEATTGRRYNGDPVFHGWYAEAGFFLTGERRGYRAGLWDRTRVRRPFGQGGPGAIQVNVRYDVLDLDDRVAGSGVAPTDYVAGGRETGILLSTIWQPIDYVRFTFQYTRATVKGGPKAPLVDTAASPQRASFSTDLFLSRAQFDF
jgi:phosphate-selective porin OprO/OprP